MFNLFKKWLSAFLGFKIFATLITLAVGAVSALIFYWRYPEKARALWKFLKRDDFEKLYELYDHLAYAMPSRDSYFIENLLRFSENAQKIFLIFSRPDLDKYKEYLKKEEYEILDNPHVVTFVMHTGMDKFFSTEKKFLTFGAHLAVNKITFPDGDEILESYFKENTPESDDSNEAPSEKNRRKKKRIIDNNKEFYTFASKKSFNLASKIDLFWQMHKEGVYIHNYLDEEDNGKTDAQKFVIEDFETPNYTIFGKSLALVETFSKRLTTFRDNGLQRSYLLIGRAGTGKSTFCLEIAKHLGGKKTMKISAELFASFNKVDLDFIFQYLRPQFVIIDDFDRVYSDYDSKSQEILYFFENLKKPENSHITVFCTVNKIERMGEAIIRPGRFDEIMVFNLPDEAEREVLIGEFSKDLGYIPDPDQTAQLVKLTKGMSHAYIKEYCLELKYDSDFDSLIRRIAVTRQFVSLEDFDNGDEMIAAFDVDEMVRKLKSSVKRAAKGAVPKRARGIKTARKSKMSESVSDSYSEDSD